MAQKPAKKTTALLRARVAKPSSGGALSRRSTGTLAYCSAVAAAFLLMASNHAEGGVSATKHNFGIFTTGQVSAQSTTEVCVFCHTPHNSNPSGPLWNKPDVGSTYNVYESQTLAATLTPNSPSLGQPTGASKLCLSCHDGAMAIGSVLNPPGASEPGTIPVTGPGVTDGKLTSSSTAFIGTDLRDDHPISFNYSRSYPSNPEIKASPFTPGSVKLDPNGQMQCTSCHDAHGTQYQKFLVAAPENGELCAACHDKLYWDINPSVHKTSTATWNEAGENPWHMDLGSAGYTDDTPEMHSCLACHRSHGGMSGKLLLKGTNPSTSAIEDEEWTCLNCHNGNVAAKDIDTVIGYSYGHNVKAYSGAHAASRSTAGEPAREAATKLGTGNRHAECVDCHNPHGSKAGNHTIGGANGNIIGANILGSWGVKPDPWGSAGDAATTYLAVDFTSQNPGGDNLEGYLCIKCHSYYAYGSVPPEVPSGNADGTYVLQSDLTADFNVNNMGFHPVFAQGKNAPPSSANPNWPANGLGLTNTFRYVDFPEVGERTGYYNMQHTSTMTCSDCHTSDVSEDPSGPHGSGSKWITTRNVTGAGTLANFCYNCHRRDVYGDEDYVGPNADFSRVSHPADGLGAASPFYASGANTGNSGNKFGILCLTCHGGAYDSTNNMMKGIHGSNASAGSQPGSDPLGYRMMNGACVESYERPSTAISTQMWFRTVTVATDPVCNNNFSDFTDGVTANYNCDTIADCSN